MSFQSFFPIAQSIPFWIVFKDFFSIRSLAGFSRLWVLARFSRLWALTVPFFFICPFTNPTFGAVSMIATAEGFRKFRKRFFNSAFCANLCHVFLSTLSARPYEVPSWPAFGVSLPRPAPPRKVYQWLSHSIVCQPNRTGRKILSKRPVNRVWIHVSYKVYKMSSVTFL
jgi:hypothetical protein